MVNGDGSADVRMRLRELADEDADARPSDDVERRLMHAWDTRGTELSRGRLIIRRQWVLAAVCLAGIAVGLAYRIERGRHQGPPSATEPTPTQVDGLDAQAFAYLDDDPASLQVLRLRATPAMLERLGVPLTGVPDESPVTIEVVLAADGTARRTQVIRAPGEW